jgi:hypothetical protein
LPVGASLLIRMHEATDMSIRELRDFMGDRRTTFRMKDAQRKPQQSKNHKSYLFGGTSGAFNQLTWR